MSRVRVPEGVPYFGSIAQLGEHLPYKQRVIGSSPIVPTKKSKSYDLDFFICADRHNTICVIRRNIISEIEVALQLRENIIDALCGTNE